MVSIETVEDESSSKKTSNTSTDKRYEELVNKMAETRKEWQEDDEEDEHDKLLSQAIDFAIQQGKGWAPGEKEAYLEKILDDDFIPPIFAENAEEVEKSGLAEAFTSLIYDEPPEQLMLDFKKKGNDAFLNGKRNVEKNMQYYRDAINHYYEAFAWAQKIEPTTKEMGDTGDKIAQEPTTKTEKGKEIRVYTENELDEIKSTLCSNAALAHLQLKNWGFVRDESKKALAFNDKNVKAWYRLAKAHQMLQNWEEAGDAIDSGLAIEGEEENKDLKKLQQLLEKKIRKARQMRQQRERNRAQRVANIKQVWKHCKENSIQLGRVPLVASVTDDDEEGGDDDEQQESRWHHHRPNTGVLPEKENHVGGGGWSWPCMFLYPSHQQSDFINHFFESEMLAERMAELFPELEEDGQETSIPWDYKNEFTCSQLAVYFEIHCSGDQQDLVHPENVELLRDQGSTMRFYEASRALMGDEGPDMANVVKAVERKHLHKQRKAWKKKHGSLWAKPDPCPVVRVHPAVTLRDVLIDKRMIIPNFLVTFFLFPENHPAHKEFLKERKCAGILQPDNLGK